MSAALAELIRSAAAELGFDAVGFAPPKLGGDERARLSAWIDDGFHAGMGYLDRPDRDRCDAATVLPESRAVVMLRLAYPAGRVPEREPEGYVASYARGPDYHRLIRERLDALIARLKERFPDLRARPFVDTAPVNERAFARAAGLGWYGKNACLLARGAGSFFFLCGLALDQTLPFDRPVADHCGTCTACLDACPTEAFDGPYRLDARRCLSYWTIEHRGAWPEDIREAAGAHIFGCDICQAVCPWNRFAAEETAFDAPEAPFQSGPLGPLLTAALASFKKLTRGSAATRAGKKGILRNIATAMGNSGDPGFLEDLRGLREHPDPAVREHAEWACARLEPPLVTPPEEETSRR